VGCSRGARIRCDIKYTFEYILRRRFYAPTNVTRLGKPRYAVARHVMPRINPWRYFQNENNIRIMPFHLRAVWNAARNKTTPGYRDVITVSLCTRLRARPSRKEGKKSMMRITAPTGPAGFQRHGILKSRRRIYPHE